jgi:hypothetical protein
MVRPDNVTVRPTSGSSTRLVGRPPEFWLAGGETQIVTLRVRAGSNAADQAFTVRLSSTRGGVAEREVRLQN